MDGRPIVYDLDESLVYFGIPILCTIDSAHTHSLSIYILYLYL